MLTLLLSLGLAHPPGGVQLPHWVGSAYAGDASEVIDVGVGESVVRREPRALSRVLISDPTVASLKLLEEGQFQVLGNAVGTTDLWVWYRDDPDHPRVFEVHVQNDLSDMTRRVNAAVPGVAPRVYAVKDRVVVEGEVPDMESAERVASVARIYDKNFVNLMTVKGDPQVQLHVTFAEVSRTGLRELGLNILGQSSRTSSRSPGRGRLAPLLPTRPRRSRTRTSTATR